MSLYQQSSLTLTQAKVQVARTLSLENDAEMLVHAGDAIKQAFQDWNNKRQWNFTKSAITLVLIAPIEVPTVTLTNGSVNITSAAGFGSVVAGDIAVGSGLQNETTVTTVTDSSNIVLSRAAVSPTSPATVTFYRRDYALPTAAGAGVRYIYSVRLVTSDKVLYPLNTRLGDRLDPDSTDVGEPRWYDDFPMGEQGKIRFVPTPNGAGTVIVKMNRRLTIPTSEGTAIDIPEDFEFGLLARAKGYFLLDKTDGSPMSDRWFAIGEARLAEAVGADSKKPDEDSGFLPSTYAAGSVDTTTLSYALAQEFEYD